MFTIKIGNKWSNIRVRMEAIKARIKERRKAALENVKSEPCHKQEKVNANS